MNNLERLKQYISKASFSAEVDRLAAFQCLDGLLEDIEDAAVRWSSYVEVDHAPMVLRKYISEVIGKDTTK